MLSSLGCCRHPKEVGVTGNIDLHSTVDVVIAVGGNVVVAVAIAVVVVGVNHVNTALIATCHVDRVIKAPS